MARRKQNPRVSIRNLKISNFKGLGKFEMEFPRPALAGDPDVFVLGSKNGLGKTSILESCAMLFLAATAQNKDRVFRRFVDASFDPYDLLIRAGAETAKLSGHFELDGKGADVHLTLRRASPEIDVSGDIDVFRKSEASQRGLWDNAMETFSLMLAGLSSDPLVLPGLLYFHSFRKVQEGNPEFGMMVSEQRRFRRQRLRPYEMPTSRFKIEILRSMMRQADLFETLDEGYSDNTLDKLNELVRRYAGGNIQKLRPAADNTLDFRIHPTDGGDSFAFDGLSSGQKEIISTLFLIWHYTHETPAIVLIDEPELHLNVEWHRDFLDQAAELSPVNQYLAATHSEDIFASVDVKRRALLVEEEETHGQGKKRRPAGRGKTERSTRSVRGRKRSESTRQ